VIDPPKIEALFEQDLAAARLAAATTD